MNKRAKRGICDIEKELFDRLVNSQVRSLINTNVTQ